MVRVTFLSGVVRIYDLATYAALPMATLLGSRAEIISRLDAIAERVKARCA